MQTITPYLLYEDVSSAIHWLSRAFGFEERVRFADDTGTVKHAELTLGDGEIYATEDPEGHRWSFAQLLREVPAEEWGATPG